MTTESNYPRWVNTFAMEDLREHSVVVNVDMETASPPPHLSPGTPAIPVCRVTTGTCAADVIVAN